MKTCLEENIEVEWKDIDGFPNYKISSTGSVYSVHSNKLMKLHLRGTRADNKYLVVCVSKEGIQKNLSIHRLVAQAFIPNPENLPCVNHIDGNKFNNDVSNLEWCTYSENNYHAFRTGLKHIPSGVTNKLCKLTYDDVVWIKNNIILGSKEFGTRPIARKYGVDHTVIKDIFRDNKYADVKVPHTYFICSDIHGAFTLWQQALNDAGFDINRYSHKIIICGDLMDRFDEAIKCYEFVKRLKQLNKLIYIRGNHEDLLFDCVNELQQTGGCASPHHWSNGTVDTIKQLKEFGLLEEVLHFIKDNAIDYYELGDYVFAHAGLPLKLTYENGKPILVINKEASEEEFKKHRWDNPIENLKKGELPNNKIMVVGHWHCFALWHYLYPDKYGDFDSDDDLDENFNICKTNNLIMIDACTVYSCKVNVLKINEKGEIL